jgi:hypothetical protein
MVCLTKTLTFFPPAKPPGIVLSHFFPSCGRALLFPTEDGPEGPVATLRRAKLQRSDATQVTDCSLPLHHLAPPVSPPHTVTLISPSS